MCNTAKRAAPPAPASPPWHLQRFAPTTTESAQATPAPELSAETASASCSLHIRRSSFVDLRSDPPTRSDQKRTGGRTADQKLLHALQFRIKERAASAPRTSSTQWIVTSDRRCRSASEVSARTRRGFRRPGRLQCGACGETLAARPERSRRRGAGRLPLRQRGCRSNHATSPASLGAGSVVGVGPVVFGGVAAGEDVSGLSTGDLVAVELGQVVGRHQ
jgi:hypothetical protein